MIKILVVYHSQTGSTQRMAEAVAKGVSEVEGVCVDLKRASDATIEDLLECDGIALGTPEYFGYMSGALKDFFDRTYEEAHGHVFRKPYVIFISAGNDGRGALASIERICLGYQFKKVYAPVIARGDICREDIERCIELGKVLAAGLDLGIY